MLHPVVGDILLSRAEAIAHAVARSDPMSIGLSAALSGRFPGLPEAYQQWCRDYSPEPGSVWVWRATKRTRIVSLVTHEGNGADGRGHDAVSTRGVERALKTLARLITAERIEALAIPRLATGSGGLAWPAVWPLIEEQLGQLSLPIYVYAEYRAGHQAEEALS